MYLSRLEEEILGLDTKLSYPNITKLEREALETLRNDNSIIIKEADKGSAIVVWDREDYCKEAEGQISDPEVYEKVSSDVTSPLIGTILTCLEKIRQRGDMEKATLEYFLVPEPRIGRFYLLPKVHKCLNCVPGEAGNIELWFLHGK